MVTGVVGVLAGALGRAVTVPSAWITCRARCEAAVDGGVVAAEGCDATGRGGDAKGGA